MNATWEGYHQLLADRTKKSETKNGEENQLTPGPCGAGDWQEYYGQAFVSDGHFFRVDT